jgi:hypothetical protein
MSSWFENRPWLLLAPPIGFALFIFYPKNRLRAPLFASGMLLFIGAVLVNVACFALVSLCPFFIEPGVEVLCAALRTGWILLWTAAVWQVWMNADKPDRLPWFEAIRRHPFTARLDEPFRSA